MLQSSSITQHFPTEQGSLQIVHINNNHWVVASTLNCHKAADISIYDSLNSSVNKRTRSILARLLKTKQDTRWFAISFLRQFFKHCMILTGMLLHIRSHHISKIGVQILKSLHFTLISLISKDVTDFMRFHWFQEFHWFHEIFNTKTWLYLQYYWSLTQ